MRDNLCVKLDDSSRIDFILINHRMTVLYRRKKFKYGKRFLSVYKSYTHLSATLDSGELLDSKVWNNNSDELVLWLKKFISLTQLKDVVFDL